MCQRSEHDRVEHVALVHLPREVVQVSRSVLKVAAFAPAVVASTLLTVAFAPLLPPLAGWVLFVGGLLAMTALSCGPGEDFAIRALFRGRRLTTGEERLLAPAVRLLCQRGLCPPVTRLWVRDSVHPISSGGVGRRSVIVSGGLIAAVRDGQLPSDQAAAVIAHAAGTVRAGVVRCDAALKFWTVPWQLVRNVGVGAARWFAWIPLAGLAWRLRFIVGGIALVQGLIDGRPAAIAAGIGAGLVVALSYLTPRLAASWATAVSEAGDHEVDRAGLGEPLAAYLRRCPRSPETFERIHRLSGAAPASRPSLAAVSL